MEKLRTYLSEERGRLTSLATHLGLRPGTITQWKNVPSEHLRGVSEHTGIPIEGLLPHPAETASQERASA